MWVGRDCGVTTLRWGVDSNWSSSLSSLCTEAACSSSITCRARRQEAVGASSLLGVTRENPAPRTSDPRALPGTATAPRDTPDLQPPKTEAPREITPGLRGAWAAPQNNPFTKPLLGGGTYVDPLT